MKRGLLVVLIGVGLIAGGIGCQVANGTNGVTVGSINIDPPGGMDITQLTATISAQGSGQIEVGWIVRPYSVDSTGDVLGEAETAKVETLSIPDDGTYYSYLSAPGGEVLAGNYRVCVSDSDGTTLSETGNVICGVTPLADFTYSVGERHYQFGYPVTVWADSTHYQVTWEWDFGPGSSPFSSLSEARSGCWYKQSGTKTITLTVSNMYATASVSKRVAVY